MVAGKRAFKLPLYWGDLWKDLPNREVGIIFDAIIEYALTGNKKTPKRISAEGLSVFARCLGDVEYQKEHPKSYKRPESVNEIRNSIQYREWRAAVYERDRYTCQNCGRVGGRLNAHHIKPFSKYPELRTDVDNGITLCEGCHKLAHKGRIK